TPRRASRKSATMEGNLRRLTVAGSGILSPTAPSGRSLPGPRRPVGPVLWPSCRRSHRQTHRSVGDLDASDREVSGCNAFVDAIADMMAKEPAQRVASALAVIDRLAPWA